MIDEELIEAIGKLVAADRRRKQKQKQQAARWELISQQYDSSRASSLSSRGSKTTPHPAADWVLCVDISRCSMFRRRSKQARWLLHHAPPPPLPSTIILILSQIQQQEYQERQQHQQRERHDHEFREDDTSTDKHATNTTDRRISTATTVATSV